MTMTPGEVIFRKGDEAKEIIFVMSGSLKIPELGIAIPPGEVVGELGMLSPEKVRTQSAVCVDGGQLLVVTYDQVRQLFFQNPKFGYFFMQLSAKRLFENLKRAQAGDRNTTGGGIAGCVSADRSLERFPSEVGTGLRRP